jgi:hypothetical protein
MTGLPREFFNTRARRAKALESCSKVREELCNGVKR